MNLLPINGQFEINDDEIIYDPKYNQSTEQSQGGYIKSNQYFKNGKINFKLHFKEKASSFNLVLNERSSPYILITINSEEKAYAIRTLDNTNTFQILNSDGDISTIPLDQDIDVSVNVSDSLIELYVNNICVCRAFIINTLFDSQLALWVYGENKVIIKSFQVEAVKPTIFVIMEFSKEYNELYQEVIKPICESDEFGCQCHRADEMYTNTLIMQDIITSIRNTNLIVADITPNNPNVYYELGYAHGIHKPTVLLCNKERSNLPFDISGIRTIFYENSIKGRSKLEQHLKNHLRSIMSARTNTCLPLIQSLSEHNKIIPTNYSYQHNIV